MTNRNPRAFPDLAPPPGGLARLRDRLDGVDRRRARLLTLAFVPSLAAAAVVAFVVVAPGRGEPAHGDALDHPALVEHAAPPSTAAVDLGGGVTLYWVP